MHKAREKGIIDEKEPISIPKAQSFCMLALYTT